MFLEDISWVFPLYGKEGLQLRKIEVPTVESEGISDMMPKTFNKNLLNGSQPSSNPDIHHYVEFICTAKFQNLRTYYRNEKKKLSSFTSGTGARDFAPKWEHFTRLQFLDDTIEPLDSTSNLDYMELEINATPLNVSMEDAFQNVVELPPIPCSEEPQGARVSPSTPLMSPSTPLLSTSKPKEKKERSTTVVKPSMKACKNAWGLWARKQ
ncbi:hypothetical protein TNIN_8021 [Trichonephila inaurata madagascariensis]|uniref:MADF domain-containing protein n=1 Tax=Trichonephila inaurata madagascariensis TaxID=2747483 RepID=A0A8X7CB60_9ARAC|nr:hypothetical protein TNIN_8021 [Trichonephila inaurata madagascariensis]